MTESAAANLTAVLLVLEHQQLIGNPAAPRPGSSRINARYLSRLSQMIGYPVSESDIREVEDRGKAKLRRGISPELLADLARRSSHHLTDQHAFPVIQSSPSE